MTRLARSFSVRHIRRLEARALTIQLKAAGLAHDVNELFGVESDTSNFADDVLCTAENLVDGLSRLPGILKNGGRP